MDARGQAHAHVEAARSEPRFWGRPEASARPKPAPRAARARAWRPHEARGAPEAGARGGARPEAARHETHGQKRRNPERARSFGAQRRRARRGGHWATAFGPSIPVGVFLAELAPTSAAGPLGVEIANCGGACFQADGIRFL